MVGVYLRSSKFICIAGSLFAMRGVCLRSSAILSESTKTTQKNEWFLCFTVFIIQLKFINPRFIWPQLVRIDFFVIGKHQTFVYGLIPQTGMLSKVHND